MRDSRANLKTSLTLVDSDTFLTTLYVMIDDFCKSLLCPEHRSGAPASLTPSEVLTLALFGQWQRFSSERAFYRDAQRHLRGAFPSLPDRRQFNRLLRQQPDALVAFSVHLVQRLQAQHCAYEVLDATAVPTRDAKRRGVGWLPGLADIGWSNRLGWYEGLHVLVGPSRGGHHRLWLCPRQYQRPALGGDFAGGAASATPALAQCRCPGPGTLRNR